jgi:hypothetical protein
MSSYLRAHKWMGMTAAATAALVATMLPGSMEAASAKPPAKPGRVTGLQLSANLDTNTYTVHANWIAAAKATAYQVTMTNHLTGSVLDRGKVAATSFDGTAPHALVGKRVDVSVVPFNGTRRARGTTGSLSLPDQAAPTASYTVTPQDSLDGEVTIEVNAISDDLSDVAHITQLVNWGDGTPAESHLGTGTTPFTHSYGAVKNLYHPTVTVSDEEGNERTFDLTSVVGDITAPSGTFSRVAPSTVWARWTRVRITKTSLIDDLSDPSNIAKSVDWGDGKVQNWGPSLTLAHRYAVAGPYSPMVTITDEAGNQTGPLPTSTSPVTVTADSVAPRLHLTLPTAHRNWVSNWTRLKGHVTDSATGVRNVQARAIEKRGTRWYAFKPGRQVWVRAGKTRTSAWQLARPAVVKPTATHTWSVRLYHLRQGLLVYKVSAVDHVGNRTHWKWHHKELTHR